MVMSMLVDSLCTYDRTAQWVDSGWLSVEYMSVLMFVWVSSNVKRLKKKTPLLNLRLFKWKLFKFNFSIRNFPNWNFSSVDLVFWIDHIAILSTYCSDSLVWSTNTHFTFEQCFFFLQRQPEFHNHNNDSPRSTVCS